MLIYSLSVLFTTLVSFASADCANVDLNQLSDDKIPEYTHCFRDAEVTVNETPKAKSKLKFAPVCDRSAPVKLKLEEIFNNSCEQITKDMLLAYNGNLIVSKTDYRKPKLGDFSGMRNLKTLGLLDCNVEILPSGLLDDLENLQKLSLSWNQIEYIPSNLFNSLLKLEELYLHRNVIKKLPESIFDALINLKKLNLGFNKIKEVPKKTFDKLLKLEKLWLYYNKIHHLLHPLFISPNNSLVRLELASNPLYYINDSAFKNMTQLQNLNLSKTNLTIIGKNVFKPLESLETLNLSFISAEKSELYETNEPSIWFQDISLSQFTSRNPFPLKQVYFGPYNEDSSHKDFMNQLEKKGVSFAY